ncbi:MAG: hypothetical protein ACI8V4_003222 [Ilumatobacter sp.]|jgi:hypothetical protein
MVHSSGWKLRSEDETSALRALISLASRNRLATQNRHSDHGRPPNNARSARRKTVREVPSGCTTNLLQSRPLAHDGPAPLLGSWTR